MITIKFLECGVKNNVNEIVVNNNKKKNMIGHLMNHLLDD